MSKVLGGSSGRNQDDYVELDDSMLSGSVSTAATQLHTANIKGQEDLMNIKDALYDGDLVIADIKHVESNGLTVEQVVKPLQQVVEEINGDIVQKESDQLILTPEEVSISRERL